jgi:hypothetical protein
MPEHPQKATSSCLMNELKFFSLLKYITYKKKRKYSQERGERGEEERLWESET